MILQKFYLTELSDFHDFHYLEHSRIYILGIGNRQKVYITSTDFMTRNTLRRVEVAVPILDRDLRNCLTEMFQIMLRDNCQARELQSSGEYVRVRNQSVPLNAQEYFYEEAYRNAAELAVFNKLQLHGLAECLCKCDKDASDFILRYAPERIHTMIPGLMILQYLVERFQVEDITVSHYGVREGYIQQKIQPTMSETLS